MFIISSGLGPLIVVIPGIISAIFIWFAFMLFGDAYMGQQNWPFVVAALIAGIMTWRWGKKKNGSTGRYIVDPKSKEKFPEKGEHSIFFIPAQYWSVVYFGLAITFSVSADFTDGFQDGVAEGVAEKTSSPRALEPTTKSDSSKGKAGTSSKITWNDLRERGRAIQAAKEDAPRELWKIDTINKVSDDSNSWIFNLVSSAGNHARANIGNTMGRWVVGGYENGKLRLLDQRGEEWLISH